MLPCFYFIWWFVATSEWQMICCCFHVELLPAHFCRAKFFSDGIYIQSNISMYSYSCLVLCTMHDLQEYWVWTVSLVSSRPSQRTSGHPWYADVEVLHQHWNIYVDNVNLTLWLFLWCYIYYYYVCRQYIPVQLRLERQRQVWFIPLVDECGVCR